MSMSSVGDFSRVATGLDLPMAVRYGGTAIGALLGTAAVILVNQPMPSAFLGARVGEASFSLFAVIGAWMTRRDSWDGRGMRGLQWTDGVAAILIVLMVRLMVRGIPFAP
jgi:hypothetical protein